MKRKKEFILTISSYLNGQKHIGCNFEGIYHNYIVVYILITKKNPVILKEFTPAISNYINGQKYRL